MHIASKEKHTKIVKLLLEHGADIHTKDQLGKTALMKAVETKYMIKGHIESIKLLLKYGTDIHTEDQWSKNTLMKAGKMGIQKSSNYFQS